MQRFPGATITHIYQSDPAELLDTLGAWHELTFEPQTNGATTVSLQIVTPRAREVKRLVDPSSNTFRIVLRNGIWRMVWSEIVVRVSIVEATGDGLILSGVVHDPLPRQWFLQSPLLEVYVYSRQLERYQRFEHTFS